MDIFQELFAKKYLILMLIVCLVFLILIIKAFDYLPESQSINSNEIQNINLPQPEQSDENYSETRQNESTNEEIHVLVPSVSNDTELVEDMPQEAIKENNTPLMMEETNNELTLEEQVEKIFANVKNLREEKQLTKAIEELQKVPTLTTNSELQARSYEEMASIYAIVKRYGTALSFAQKAFNLSPTSSREILLARLYYKTGDIDKATRRVNNVLQRDFAQDRN